MKEIMIVCHLNGVATVTTDAIHISNENYASKIIIDFSENVDYEDDNKWIDIIAGNGDSKRVDLGSGFIKEYEIPAEIMAPGKMTFTPFIWDGLTPKIKFASNRKILIHNQVEAS